MLARTDARLTVGEYLWRNGMTAKRLLVSCVLVILLYLTFTPPAFAYLDPGTGSYIFQIIIAAIVGLGFIVKIYWAKIKAFLTRTFSKKAETPGENENA
jgi:ABC-type Na+ efflux pump permease subunit